MALLDSADRYADAFRNRLQNQLPALIDADNEVYSDFELKVPVGYSDGVEDFFAYPHVEVAPGDGRIENFSLQNVDADLAIPIIARGWLQEVLSTQKLHRLLLRLGSLMIQVGADPEAFGARHPNITRIEWRSRRNPETESARPEAVTSAVTIFFWLDDVVRLRG